MHWSRGWSCTNHVANHTLISSVISAWSANWSVHNQAGDECMIRQVISVLFILQGTHHQKFSFRHHTAGLSWPILPTLPSSPLVITTVLCIYTNVKVAQRRKCWLWTSASPWEKESNLRQWQSSKNSLPPAHPLSSSHTGSGGKVQISWLDGGEGEKT